MEEKTRILIAVGACVTANCQPCLNTAVSQAKVVGVNENEIQEAVAIARMVRKGAAGKMDKFAVRLIGNGEKGQEAEPECMATEEEIKEWVNQEDTCGCEGS